MKETKKKWYEKMPHIFIILFGLILFAGILTWIVPAGVFERESIAGTSAQVIVPNTYHLIEQNPANLLSVFKAIVQGLNASSNIIFMILIASGAFAVITSTGAIENGLGMMLNKINKSKIPPIFVIWLVTFLFSGFGIMVGPEIQIPFTLISVSIALGLGYDLIVGLAMILGGGYVGFASAPINASTVGTAQTIGGLPYYSGMELRWVFWFISTLVTCVVITTYANKIKKNPDKSLVKGIDTSGLGFSKSFDDYHLNKKHIMILLIFASLFILFIVGPTQFGWYLEEISATLIIAAILAAIVYGYKSEEMINIFIKGSASMMLPAFTVGMGRAIQVVLSEGQVLDTIINAISAPLMELGVYGAGALLVIVHAIVNFFMPSGSGQAAALMPIMFPIGDMIGLTRQCSVLAFQIGDGFCNIIIPTLGSVIAMCGLAKVPFDKWFRFAIKLFLSLIIIGTGFLMFAIYIDYGPF